VVSDSGPAGASPSPSDPDPPADGSRWARTSDVPRGAEYDARWAKLAAEGRSVHGEAEFICRYEPASVFDAGCGTGRVAIELARRGIDVVGVDLDRLMLTEARRKASDLTWVEADLRTVRLGRTFDVVAAPGNVLIFLAPGSEADVVANLAAHLAPGRRLIAGFQLNRAYRLDAYDADCAAAGLELTERYATWEGEPFAEGDYAVSVHSRQQVPS